MKMSGDCSICLSSFKNPVSIPCGHVYCTKCLADHVNEPNNEDFKSYCPTCRKVFNIVTPDLTYLPKKYHQYVVPSVRRIYIDTDLKKKLTTAEARIKKLETDQEILLKQCEQHMAAANAHAGGEKEAKQQIERLKYQLDDMITEMEVRQEASMREVKQVKEARDSLSGKYQKLRQRFRDLEIQFAESNTPPSPPKISDKQLDTLRYTAAISGSGISDATARQIRPLPRCSGERGRMKTRTASPPPIYNGRSKRPRLSALADLCIESILNIEH